MPRTLQKPLENALSRQHDMVRPVYLKLLAESIGAHNKTAQKLGISDATVSHNIREGATKKTTELAAEYLYKKDYAPDQDEKFMALVVADESTMVTIKRMVQAVEGQFKSVKLEA